MQGIQSTWSPTSGAVGPVFGEKGYSRKSSGQRRGLFEPETFPKTMSSRPPFPDPFVQGREEGF